MSGSPFHASTAAAEIYDAGYVRRLFDEMAPTYGFVNIVSSFGFCVRWRGRCLLDADVRPGDRVLDLMSGMGELWPSISRRLRAGALVAVDFSDEMCKRSAMQSARCDGLSVDVRRADVLEVDLPGGSFDAVVCSFGLKTLTPVQQRMLASRVAAWLRPGGRFAFIEISRPSARWVRWPYFAYLKWAIPLIGRIFLGNPECYRMLGRYTDRFGDCDGFVAACREAGLNVNLGRHFHGCATSAFGSKPA